MSGVLRVLSYNVRSLRDSAAGVAAVIRACAPDVVCVQEAPRFAGWRAACTRLAADSGLVVVTGGRAAGAMLLLARPDLPVLACRDVKLPWHPPLHRRGLALGVVEVGGARVAVGSLHLSLHAAERLAQARLVLDAARGFGVPVVVAGDVNERPDGPAWRLLARELRDAYAVAPDGPGDTYPVAAPRKRIDGVFVDRALGIGGCGVPAVPEVATASDHCPVLATVSVG